MEEGRTQRPLHQPAPPPTPAEVGEGRDEEDPQLQLRPSDSPAGEGLRSRKLLSSWGPAQEELGHPWPWFQSGSARSRLGHAGARDLPLWASGSLVCKRADGLEMDARSPSSAHTAGAQLAAPLAHSGVSGLWAFT